MARKRRPLVWMFAVGLLVLPIALAGIWYAYYRQPAALEADGKIAVLLSSSDEISFYLSLETKPQQQKKAVEFLRGLVRENLSTFGCGPFDEENLEIAPSESRPAFLTVAYAAFHCESEPFEDLAYEVDLLPFAGLFSLADLGHVSVSVARINQAEQNISCMVDEQPGCEFTIARGQPFPKQLSINLNDGEPFALKARSRKPIDISCEQLSPDQVIGERFIDIQHIMSDQIHIMRDDALSMKQARICQQLMLFSLKRDAESGLDSIHDALLVPPLGDAETLADNCWDNPEKIPVPGLVGIIESGKDETILEARQAWDIALSSGQLLAPGGKVYCRETPAADGEDIWGSVRSQPSRSQLQVATKTLAAPPALQSAHSGQAIEVWEIDLDSNQKKDFIVQVGAGGEAKTCVHDHEGLLRSCLWPNSEDVSRYVWFAQLDEDPYLELIEMDSDEMLGRQRLSKIDPKTWELRKQFDLNPLIEGRYKDRNGIFFAYPSDISDLALGQGRLRASFFPGLYEGQERSGPFLVFKGVPSQGQPIEVPDLKVMGLAEILTRHRQALENKLYQEDGE